MEYKVTSHSNRSLCVDIVSFCVKFLDESMLPKCENNLEGLSRLPTFYLILFVFFIGFGSGVGREGKEGI